MDAPRAASRLSLILFLTAATLFAAASGVFVRDFGAGYRESYNGPIDVGSGFEQRTNLYQLTYEYAVFSTVEVRITIFAEYGGQRIEATSNGSYLTTFRPKLPGLYHFVILNLANVSGELGWSLLLSQDVPPELETAVLEPALYASAGLLIAAVVLSIMPKALAARSPEERTT